MVKLTEKQITEMKAMRKKGITFSAIAKEFKIAKSTSQYHLNDSYKQSSIRRAKKWDKHHREICRERQKRYRKKDPERYQRQVYLGTIRWGLRKSLATPEEVIEIVNQVKAEASK